MPYVTPNISNSGLETEGDYPYDGVDEKCNIKSTPAVYINGSVAISDDEAKMASWLAMNGPISIGINAAVMQVNHLHGWLHIIVF